MKVCVRFNLKKLLFQLQVFLKIFLHVVIFFRKSKELPRTYDPSQVDVIFGLGIESWQIELG